MITLNELKKKCDEFEKEEGRSDFYYLALEIKDKYPIHATVIILATWNIGRFRYMLSDPQNLSDLKKALESCMPLFRKLSNVGFKTANFDKLREDIKSVYSTLSKVNGVEYTGASKIFHLFCPNLIVMWDSYIRKEYSKRKYRDTYKIKIQAEKPTAEDFLNFQKLMQKIFGHIKWDNKRKTLPKAIDEYNYVTYTLPQLKKKKAKNCKK